MAARFKIEDLPKGDFHLSEIVDKYYPECIGNDTEGRTYNKASSTVSRLLKKMKCVLELKDGYFFNGL